MAQLIVARTHVDSRLGLECQMKFWFLNSDICYKHGIVEAFTEAEESLIGYLAGWLARKSGICSGCQDVLSRRISEHSSCCPANGTLAVKKWFIGSSSVGLVEPCDELFAAVHQMEELFRMLYARLVSEPHTLLNRYSISFIQGVILNFSLSGILVDCGRKC